MNYEVTRYEEKSNELFVCIRSLGKPLYKEHFFTAAERATDKTRAETMERLIAELEINDDEYVAPELAVVKLEEVKNLDIKAENIAIKKQEILNRRN